MQGLTVHRKRQEEFEMEIPLTEIKLFENAYIVRVSHPDKKMQRRLFDLGFYEGTTVKKILVSPHGDPIAYKIKGATIALRNDDARYISVKGREN